MEKEKQWMVRNKQPLVLVGVIGLMLAPFLWPFFLAVIVQTVSLAIPVLIVGIVVKKIRKEKPNEQKRNPKYTDTESAKVYTGENIQERTPPKGKKIPSSDSIRQRNESAGMEQIKRSFGETQRMSDAACMALMWYQLEGREKILRLIKKLEKEGRQSFSISPEGICSVREADRFRRVGALRSYPGREVGILKQELQKDHIRTDRKGKYLWLFWGKGI